MESLRPRTDENTLSLWRNKIFLRDTVKLNVCEVHVSVSVRLFVRACSGQVTMERAKPLSNISYFNPQQSGMSTKTQPRINNRGRGGRDAGREKKPLTNMLKEEMEEI